VTSDPTLCYHYTCNKNIKKKGQIPRERLQARTHRLSNVSDKDCSLVCLGLLSGILMDSNNFKIYKRLVNGGRSIYPHDESLVFG
jgi:hypothetical protein